MLQQSAHNDGICVWIKVHPHSLSASDGGEWSASSFSHFTLLPPPSTPSWPKESYQYKQNIWQLSLNLTQERRYKGTKRSHLVTLWEKKTIHTLYNSQILHKSVPWPTAEAQVQFQVSPYRICGEQGGTKRSCPTSTSVLPCEYHSNSAPNSLIHSPNTNVI